MTDRGNYLAVCPWSVLENTSLRASTLVVTCEVCAARDCEAGNSDQAIDLPIITKFTRMSDHKATDTITAEYSITDFAIIKDNHCAKPPGRRWDKGYSHSLPCLAAHKRRTRTFPFLVLYSSSRPIFLRCETAQPIFFAIFFRGPECVVIAKRLQT